MLNRSFVTVLYEHTTNEDELLSYFKHPKNDLRWQKFSYLPRIHTLHNRKC